MPSRSPFLEIQVHAQDIRRGVRYIFLSKVQVVVAVLAGSAFLAWLGWTATLAPGVLRGFQARQEYRALGQARVQHGERLQGLIGRMDRLAVRTEEVRLRMQKVYLAYGLPDAESVGQGGFPFEPAPVPDSIYAGTILHGNTLAAGIAEEMHVLGAFLQEVQAFEAEHAEQVHSTPSISPLRGPDFVLTSPFGSRRNPFTKETDFHAGVDLAATIGTEVRAPADGVVVFAGRYDLRRSVAWWRYGNLVVLRHGDRFITLYGHCDEVLVRRGQAVVQDEVIATVGNTGWSTNPHLHYEVRRHFEGGDYEPVDPRIYILDHRWRDEERLLVRARTAPSPGEYEPLPGRFGR